MSKKNFTQNVTCDYIKITQKSGLHPLSRKHYFRKATGGSNWPPPTFPPTFYKREQITPQEYFEKHFDNSDLLW